MKHILTILLTVATCYAQAPDEVVSHYVIHADSGEYKDNTLIFSNVEKNIDIYLINQRIKSGSVELSTFIDKVYKGDRGHIKTQELSFPLEIKNLRYNPYNERLTLELKNSPLHEGVTLGSSTLTFY